MNLCAAADDAFEAYDFGESDVTSHESTWDMNGNRTELTKSCYVVYRDEEDAADIKVTFTVNLDANGKVTGATALEHRHGEYIGEAG